MNFLNIFVLIIIHNVCPTKTICMLQKVMYVRRYVMISIFSNTEVLVYKCTELRMHVLQYCKALFIVLWLPIDCENHETFHLERFAIYGILDINTRSALCVLCLTNNTYVLWTFETLGLGWKLRWKLRKLRWLYFVASYYNTLWHCWSHVHLEEYNFMWHS